MSVEKYEVYVRLPLICGWGAQAFGRLPLKNAVLITSIADAALHYSFKKKDASFSSGEAVWCSPALYQGCYSVLDFRIFIGRALKTGLFSSNHSSICTEHLS